MIRNLALVAWFCLAVLSAGAQTNQAAQVETKAQRDTWMAWWRAARFGMFIHWGLYAVLASQFNPVKFDAASWVHLAKSAGMKYIVITAKHHDGFAVVAYETAILQLAPCYLNGLLATFAPRSYPDMEAQRPWGVAVLPWVYFGGVAPDKLSGQWALCAATAKYRLPDYALPIGTNRAASYLHRSLMNRWALYHFVNKNYVLFSRSPKAQGKGFQGQSYPCGVMWEEPAASKDSHLWITNPSADDEKTSGLHTHGVTEHEQEVQNRDALLFVFNIPDDFRNPFVLGYVPGGYRVSLTSSNRIYLHYGSVLVAVTSVDAFDWNPNSGIAHPASKPRAGDSEFRVLNTKTAVAIETALPSEFPAKSPAEQLAAFRDQLLAKSKIEFQFTAKPIGRYTDRAGHVLECEFDGTDKIDGAPVDYAHWPVLENPWMHQDFGSQALRLQAGGKIVTYDFARWKIAELNEGKP